MGARDRALWINDRRLSGRDSKRYKSHTAADNNNSVTSLDRTLAQLILEKLGSPSISFILWNGETICLNQTHEDTARLRIYDRGVLFQLMRNAELYFGDLVASGRLEIEGDWVSFFEKAYHGMRQAREAGSSIKKLFQRIRSYVPHTNTLATAKSRIHHHYDISNEFYRLWLDKKHMQYTCAYYSNDTLDLEQAQEAKLDHVCRKLHLQPGDTVVEAGCGWGALARHMARNYGVTVKAYNISHEQIHYAREAAKLQGLDDKIEYVEDDYRNIQGQYDVFVSVGMLEHVGRDSMKTLGKVVNRALKANGRGLIHSIGRNKPQPMNAWIERRIFPGAYPPSLGEMMHIFEPQNFSVLDVENLRRHYVQTLRHWLRRYDDHQEQIESMFDKEFVRAWRLYLAGSVAAFSTSDLQLFQVLFSRPEVDSLPMTRDHLYLQDKQ